MGLNENDAKQTLKASKTTKPWLAKDMDNLTLIPKGVGLIGTGKFMVELLNVLLTLKLFQPKLSSYVVFLNVSCIIPPKVFISIGFFHLLLGL